MRDFNEIKAEILRRSDNRIKEKKRKRKLYTAYALSLCLCVTVAAALFPKLMRFQEAELADKAPNEGIFTDSTISKSEATEMSKEAMFAPSEDEMFDTADIIVVSAEFKNENGCAALSDFEDVAKLEELIDNLFNDEEISEDEVAEEGTVISKPSYDDFPEEPVEYQELVIKYSNGMEISYRLKEKSLENAVTGTAWSLTEDEYDFIIGLFSK